MKKLSEENELLKELLQEEPELLYFTEIGIMLGDYMSAFTALNEDEMRGSAKVTNFSLCLVLVLSRRYDKFTKFVQ